jgi:hypothetical protein
MAFEYETNPYKGYFDVLSYSNVFREGINNAWSAEYRFPYFLFGKKISGNLIASDPPRGDVDQAHNQGNAYVRTYQRTTTSYQCYHKSFIRSIRIEYGKDE